MFVVTAAILVYSISDANGFQLIWRYFSWANQVLAAVTLWAISVYLAKNKGKMWYLVTLIPALFMTMVTSSFLFVAKAADGGLGSILPRPVGFGIGAAITVLGLVLFLVFLKKNKAKA
jgi:carbon starvation protein CstA